MTNAAVKDAKDTYIKTGRLNRNIISKEISISWYKCKLQNINPKDQIKHIGEKPTINFEVKFLTYIDSIVPQYFDYILVNMSLQKCSSRMQLTNFVEMDTIDDLAIGTNGGYLAYKTQNNQLVSLDEHYLECLSGCYSYGMIVSKGERILGVLMLLSNDKPNEYDIGKIKDKLFQFNEKAEVLSSQTMIDDVHEKELKQFFAYPDSYMKEFKLIIDKIGDNALPLLIKGDVGSGKSTLARFIADKESALPYCISLEDTPSILQKQYIEYGLSQFDTVIIEDLENADLDVLKLLTVYTEEILNVKYREKDSYRKCLNLIMTTIYSDEFKGNLSLSKQREKQLSKFMNKLKLNTVNLVNTSAFLNQIDILAEAILAKNSVSASDAYKIMLIEYCKTHSFKEVQCMIDISIDEAKLDDNEQLLNFPISITHTILDLETYEKEYILKVYELLDNNMTATASILNIGRSTLYRKLEKYHNET